MFEDGVTAAGEGAEPAPLPAADPPSAEPWLEAESQAWVAGLAAAGVPVVHLNGPHDPGPEPPEEAVTGTWLDGLERPELGPVSWLAELPSGARLMGELDALPGDVVADAYEGIEVVAGWARLEAYAAAKKRLAAAAVARREALVAGLAALGGVTGGLGAVADPSTAADELGLRLGLSKRAAAGLIESGRAFLGAGSLVGQALLDGAVDAAKADVIVSAVADLDPEGALAVQERVLTRAAHLPLGRVRTEVNAACAGVATARWEEQCRAERAKRRVCAPRALPFGMAGLYAVLPAVEAQTLYRAVDAAARSAKAHGDQRSMDQLRADALALMGTTAISTGWIGQPPLEGTDGDGSVGSAASAATPSGARCSGPAGIHSHGKTEPPPGMADVDETSPPGLHSAPDMAGCDAGAVGRQPSSGRASGSGRDPSPPGMRVGVIGGRSAHVRVVVPLNVLMGVHATAERDTASDGLDDAAYLDGYGPIPGEVARAVAAGSTWARLVLDPVDGSVRELSSPRYRPPPAMADLVRAEKPIGVRPGCTVAADSCDLNHDVPWPLGTTSVDNLDPCAAATTCCSPTPAGGTPISTTSTAAATLRQPHAATTAVPSRSPRHGVATSPAAGAPAVVRSTPSTPTARSPGPGTAPSRPDP